MSTRLADHCGRVLARLAAADPRLWVLDGDLADSDGAARFAERHPSRFLMAGIAEQNMVSVAAGMAEAGLLPWVFSFAAFLSCRAYDQVRVCVSQARQPVALVGSHAGGLSGRNGKTHAAVNDLALMLSLPHVSVWAPGDFADVEHAVRSLHADPQPGYVRMPRSPVRDDFALPGTADDARWLRDRRPATIVSTGLASHWAADAARRLSFVGVDVGVLHVLRLKPDPSLADRLHGVHRMFVVEDHGTLGGLGALVRRSVPDARVTSFGWPDDYSGSSGDDDELLESHGLSGSRLAAAIRTQLGADRGPGGDTCCRS